MEHSQHTSQRVVIVGGGISGLSISIELAHAGFPVTVLETSQIGFAASTRNQGWLHSGAWFARQDPALAKCCSRSLHQTLNFCPECLEPDHDGMSFLFAEENSETEAWQSAWNDVSIPFEEISLKDLETTFPQMNSEKIHQGFLLPDRAIRVDALLKRLVELAQNNRVEVRPQTPIVEILREGNRVVGVKTGRGEEIFARLVILAVNASGEILLDQMDVEQAGQQYEFTRVGLKSHLVAVEPAVSNVPFCIVDCEGFNQIPHGKTSVFGTNRWRRVQSVNNQNIMPEEIEKIWGYIARFYPNIDRQSHCTAEWAGTTIQAMHEEQIEPGVAPLPTVIDHSMASTGIENILSVYPGRATLWVDLAEQTSNVVRQKLGHPIVKVTKPPWMGS